MRPCGPVGFLALMSCSGLLSAQTAVDSVGATLNRDAGQFARCVRSHDPDCVYAMTDVEVLIEAGVRTPYADREALRQLWSQAVPADSESDGSGLAGPEQATTERLSRFEALEAGEAFRVGDRLYAFVPFYQTNTSSAGRLERTAFLVAVSTDDGETWRFTIINGLHLLAAHAAVLYPDLVGHSPPPIRNDFIPRPEPAVSRYLRTSDGLFEIREGAASYLIRLEIRRKLPPGIELIASFDNPESPNRPASLSFTLAPDQKSFELRSPPLAGFISGQQYTVAIDGFSTGTGEPLLGHQQALLFDPTLEMWELYSASSGE